MDLWVFDNDGTLYDDFGAGEQFMRIFFRYFSELLDISIEQVSSEIVRLKTKWNTEFSILALVKEHNVGFAEIVNHTYLKIKLEECNITTPDIAKFNILNSIKSRKVVFTNNPSIFARYVLSYIGLAECFSDFIGMEETRFCLKPDPNAYRVVENRHREFNRIIFCDDSLVNLEAASKLGWVTVWCKPKDAGFYLGKSHLIVSSFNDLLELELP